MDTQQIVEILSQMKVDQAKAEANREASQAKAEANRKADQERIEVIIKADKEERREEIERQIGSLASKMDTNQERMEAIASTQYHMR
jgi:hypothetical protein